MLNILEGAMKNAEVLRMIYPDLPEIHLYHLGIFHCSL
jgi:hypothetical protein